MPKRGIEGGRIVHCGRAILPDTIYRHTSGHRRHRVGQPEQMAFTNAYTLTLAANTRLAFDTLTNSPNVQLFLEGPPGQVLNNRTLNNVD